METQTLVVLRLAQTDSDHALIYSTWRNALWFAEKRDAKTSDSFFKEASEKISEILKAPETRVRMACLADDPDMLLGWAVLRNTHLEFVYVKLDYRRRGIGRLLTQGFKTFSEPQTRIGRSLAKKHQEKTHAGKEETKTSSASPGLSP